MGNKQFVTGKCPNCANELRIEVGQTITCPFCDGNVSAESIASHPANQYGNVFAQGQASSGGSAEYAKFIENPSSGLAYLENRFEVNDWDEYETSLSFDLDDIATVVEKNKVVNANDPDTWLLEFKSVLVPMRHKIAGVRKLIDEIADKYNPVDLTETFESFDTCSKLSYALVSRKANTYKILEGDLKFLEKFKAPAAVLADARREYDDFRDELEKVEVVSKIEDLPRLEKVIARFQQEIADQLAEEGINAEETYQEAIEAYNDPAGAGRALKKFQTLKGYKDSAKYIETINSIVQFNGLTEINGKLYYSVSVKPTQTFDVKQPSASPAPTPESESENFSGTTLSLFAVQDKDYDPKKPLIRGISAIITSYGGKLFYLYDNKEIRAYDFTTNTSIPVDAGKPYCYAKSSKNPRIVFTYSTDRKAIFMRKRLEAKPAILQNSGCSKKKQPEEAPPSLNNFSLIKVDLETAQMQVAIPEIVDVMDAFGDYIFFTQSRRVNVNESEKGDAAPKVPKTFFSSYNTKTGVIRDVLDEHAFITNAVDGKIVFSRFSPVTYNMNLYVYDMETTGTTLLESNVYEVCPFYHDGKVFYTVGNFSRRSMFSIKLDGTERTEIMLNVENIRWFDKQWMYVVKGYGYNTTMIKISYDGKKRVVVATGIKKLVEMSAGYVYYIDNFGRLRIVRTDGKENRIIAEGCEDAEIIIDVDRIFLMNTEVMDNKGQVAETSLYQMDPEGHNLRKLYYGLEDMKKVDEKRIFLLKKEQKKYKITTPQEKGDSTVSYTNATIRTYYSYDILTHEMTPVLILGTPKSNTFEYKSGCFKSKKTVKSSVIEEVTEKKGYSRTGKMTPGQAAAEDEAERIAQAQAAQANTAQAPQQRTVNNTGCFGGGR